MSDNVNQLIEKMNQETLKKKKYLGGVSPLTTAQGTSQAQSTMHSQVSHNSNRIKAADQEILNTDKAVTNLVREHTKLRRRLEEV